MLRQITKTVMERAQVSYSMLVSNIALPPLGSFTCAAEVSKKTESSKRFTETGKLKLITVKKSKPI